MKVKNSLRNYLLYALPELYRQEIGEDRNIARFADHISFLHGNTLSGKRLRFGIAQKLINLHLKYLWTAGILIYEPPHCPIDGIIRDSAKNPNYNWTQSDCEQEYCNAITALKQKADKKDYACRHGNCKTSSADCNPKRKYHI